MNRALLLRRGGVITAGLAVLWLAGFLIFVDGLGDVRETALTPDLPGTDAIVVLTGGSERLSAGLDLLAAGKGEKLLVSGVHPGSTLERVLAYHAVSESLRNCCIILGHAAVDTLGNAQETRDWMKAENFHSLRLVTAQYHMTRSLLVFHALMPDIAIEPYPVMPESVRLEGWWSRCGTAVLFASEYNKYLFARLRAVVGLL